MEIDSELFNILVVSNVSYDEPIEEILKAAKHLPECQFYVSGNYPQKRPEVIRQAPDNVHFTGYLPDDEFYGLMKAVHVVLGLTTEDHTLQSSANEALWLGKPIITSNWPLLRSCFNRGTVHIENTSQEIIQAVQEIAGALPSYQEGILELQKERLRIWDTRMNDLIQMIEDHR
jgi:glycosyltransferase involved in cell wall biosynthesis